MDNDKIVVTQEGYEKLQNEYRNLIHVERQQAISELQEARAQGDLSENADYDAARDHQARVEARISEIEAMLKKIQIVDSNAKTGAKGVVTIGSKVEILDLSSNEKEVYQIVGAVEGDPFNGKISNVTPLAVALLDQKVGSTVTVTGVENPYDVKILSLKNN